MLKARRALLEERTNRLEILGAPELHAKSFHLAGTGGSDLIAIGRTKKLLGESDRVGRSLGDAFGHSASNVDHFLGRKHGDPEACLDRLFGGHHPPCEQEFGRPLVSDSLHEKVTASGLGDDTERYEGAAQLRVIAEIVDVRMKEHGRSEPDGGASNRGDDGLFGLNELVEETLESDLTLGRGTHLREILSRRKMRPLTSKKDHPYGLVLAGTTERIRQREIRLIVEGISHLRSIDDELAHMCAGQLLNGRLLHGAEYRGPSPKRRKIPSSSHRFRTHVSSLRSRSTCLNALFSKLFFCKFGVHTPIRDSRSFRALPKVTKGERREEMGILSWIVFGLIAGALAKLVMPGDDPGGIVMTTALGVAGALIGGFVGSTLGWGAIDGFDMRSFGLAIVGSIILLGGYRLVRRDA